MFYNDWNTYFSTWFYNSYSLLGVDHARPVHRIVTIWDEKEDHYIYNAFGHCLERSVYSQITRDYNRRKIEHYIRKRTDIMTPYQVSRIFHKNQG